MLVLPLTHAGGWQVTRGRAFSQDRLRHLL
jgi:hypothetical protein